MVSKLFVTAPSLLSGNRIFEQHRFLYRCELSTQINSSCSATLFTCSKPNPTLFIRKDCSTKPSPNEPRGVLASMWREIQGSNNWKELLDPLNPILKNEIIKYGEFVMACYHAFDLDPCSKRYCNCKYGKKSLFKEVGLDNSGYEITKYIYATPDISIPLHDSPLSSRWIGYVAVSTKKENSKLGRRDILISFRGTVTHTEWVANFMSALTPARLDPHDPRPDVKVELGFLSLYTSTDDSCKFGHASCRDQLLSELSRIIKKYKGEELSFTMAGHSMGSSLAMLLAYDIAELELNKSGSGEEIPITVYSFAGPRVGNSAFKKRCEELGVKVLRVVNVKDPVTKVPGLFLNEGFRVLNMGTEHPLSHACYVHVGVELALNFFKMRNPTCVHDLESYLGLLRSCPKRVVKKGGDFFSRASQFLRKQIPLENATKCLGSLMQLRSM